MDPFELLKKDHEKVSKLFEQIESASGRVKLTRFRKLKSELDVHSHIEETIFYPALKNAEESRDITLEGYEEHKVIKNLLAELDRAKKPTDEWTAKFTVLKESVEHHVGEEEGELFSKAKDVLTDEQAEALGDKMAAEKTKQGGTVSQEVKKPGLIKTVVDALFGGSQDKAPAERSKGRKRPSKAAKASTKSTKAKSGKRTTKRSSKKAGKPQSRVAKTDRKSSSKKAASRAKAA
jgi:hemerythrin superfamily protein